MRGDAWGASRSIDIARIGSAAAATATAGCRVGYLVLVITRFYDTIRGIAEDRNVACCSSGEYPCVEVPIHAERYSSHTSKLACLALVRTFYIPGWTIPKACGLQLIKTCLHKPRSRVSAIKAGGVANETVLEIWQRCVSITYTKDADGGAVEVTRSV